MWLASVLSLVKKKLKVLREQINKSSPRRQMLKWSLIQATGIIKGTIELTTLKATSTKMKKTYSSISSTVTTREAIKQVQMLYSKSKINYLKTAQIKQTMQVPPMRNLTQSRSQKERCRPPQLITTLTWITNHPSPPPPPTSPTSSTPTTLMMMMTAVAKWQTALRKLRSWIKIRQKLRSVGKSRMF